MPWATHSQLLTLAHVSARDEQQNTIMSHPCWSDELFCKLAYGTIMVHQPFLKAHFKNMGLDGAPSCSSVITWGELIFTAQSASVLLWHVYRTWKIDPIFVDKTYGPYVPLALFAIDIHCDQRAVLQALATLTAWHKDPFETSITLNDVVIPPVLMLLQHQAIKALCTVAPVKDTGIILRLHAYCGINMELYVRDLMFTAMTYSNITAQLPMVPAYTALIQLAGVQSLFGTPTQQQWFDAHKSVLLYYDTLVRPNAANRGKSILPVLTNLISSVPLFEKKDDNRIVGFASVTLTQPDDQRRNYLLYLLQEKMKLHFLSHQANYQHVQDLGRCSKGQFVVKHVTLAATARSFWASTKLAL